MQHFIFFTTYVNDVTYMPDINYVNDVNLRAWRNASVTKLQSFVKDKH